MELNEFVEKFANQFEDSDVKNVKEDTFFRNLETWDSLTGFAVLTMIEDDFNVELTVEEFKSVNTPVEMYNLILKKKK